MGGGWRGFPCVGRREPSLCLQSSLGSAASFSHCKNVQLQIFAETGIMVTTKHQSCAESVVKIIHYPRHPCIVYGTCCLCPAYSHHATLSTAVVLLCTVLWMLSMFPPPSPAQSSAALFRQLSHRFLCNSIISIEAGQALILKAVTPSNFIQPGGVWTMV